MALLFQLLLLAHFFLPPALALFLLGLLLAPRFLGAQSLLLSSRALRFFSASLLLLFGQTPTLFLFGQTSLLLFLPLPLPLPLLFLRPPRLLLGPPALFLGTPSSLLLGATALVHCPLLLSEILFGRHMT